jgi:hypothetical protein
MYEAYKQVNTEVRKHGMLLLLTKSGSMLYGTNTPSSDTDYKGVYLPYKESLLLQKTTEFIKLDTNKTGKANTSEDIDCHIDSIHKWLHLLEKGETNALDTLFSLWTDKVEYVDPRFEKVLKDNYLSFITSNPHAFVGYCISQTKKYNIRGTRYNELLEFVTYLRELPLEPETKMFTFIDHIKQHLTTNSDKYIKFVQAPGPRGAKIEEWTYLEVLGRKFADNITLEYLDQKCTEMLNSYGSRVVGNTDAIDWKAMSHAVRVILEVEELLSTSFIKFPLKDAEFIKQVKAGNVEIDKVQQLLTQKIELVDELLQTTTLNKEVDKREVSNLILSYYN